MKSGCETISSDTLYLKERFKNNVENFNNTLQGLKQCMDQIKKNERDNSSSQKIDKFQRVEQLLMERRNKLNNTTKTNDDSKLRENLQKNYPQLQKFQQQYQNVLEPDEQFDSDGSSFLRGGVEELIKAKMASQKNKKEGNFYENQKTERDSLGSGFLQNGNDSLQGLQRFSDINEKKAEQFLQEFEDEDSIALPDNICRLFPESSQTLERNRLSEIERDFHRKQQGSIQNNHQSHNSINPKEEQNYRSSISQQEKFGQTQLDLNSEESSAILQDLNIYQFYSSQQHALPIEDRLYVRNLSREQKIKQLQESQKQRIESEMQSIPKISKLSDSIAKNSSRFQENPDLVSRLMNDKMKKEHHIKLKQIQQQAEDEHRFTFAPAINQQSLNLNRGIDNLYQWDQKRKIKQEFAQKQLEEQEESTIQKMKQSTFICEGSKKIVEQQVRGYQKVEDRLIREGQCIQAKKKLQLEKENQMIKDMSNKKTMKRSYSNAGGLNTYSRMDESSQMNTTNKTLTKQQSCDKFSNINNESNTVLPVSYIQYCPNSFQQIEKQYEIEQESSIIPNNLVQDQFQNNYSQFYSENTNFCKQRVESFDNYSSNQQIINNNSSFFKTKPTSSSNNSQRQVLQDVSENYQGNQPSLKPQQQKPAHHKAISLHIDSQTNLQKAQAKLSYPLNAFKKSEKIMLPKSVNGRISVESLIQSAQFRKTKIFASDSQNMIILDKADNIPISVKNQGLKIHKEEGQIIDINQLLGKRQESFGVSKVAKNEQYHSNPQQQQQQQQQKENIPSSGRSYQSLSKQSSSSNLAQNKSQLQQQNNLFFQQIKSEKNGPSYANQFQKRKLQRTNSCLTTKYFSQN